MPRTGTFVQGLQGIKFWVMLGNHPANSNFRILYRRPDGTVGLDIGTHEFNNPFLRWSWYWWWYFVQLDQLGIWHIEFYVNGTILANAPFDVVASAGEIVNRPPYPISVQIEPASPAASDVLICRVGTDLVLDDADYDLVRYRYIWATDTMIVRDVTTAAHSDVLAHNVATPGSEVSCTVTPSDGIDDGPTTQDLVVLDLPVPPPVPTVSIWGLIVLGGVLLLGGGFMVRARIR